MPWGVAAAAVGAVGAIGGGLISSSGQKAASGQASVADMLAAQLAQQRYEETRGDLQPYNQTGQNNLGIYGNFYKTSADQLGDAYSNAFNHIPQPMTEDNLVKTPGYQFNLSQGLKAMQNSAAARGLGVSGAALKAAGNYGTGLADSTYQQQFGNQQTIYNDWLNQFGAKNAQLNTIYNQIGQPVTTGENAAAQTGSIGANLSGQQTSALGAAGAAQAAGTSGAASSLAGGLSSAANSAINYLGMQNALNNNNSGGGGGFEDPSAWTT